MALAWSMEQGAWSRERGARLWLALAGSRGYHSDNRSKAVDKIYEHYMLVRQEHLNQYGGLFGGVVLSTVDELAFIACSRAFPGKNFLTRAVQNAEFDVAPVLGDILEFSFHVEKVGNTSVTVHVRMSICKGTAAPVIAFDGRVVLVCVDENRRPTPVR